MAEFIFGLVAMAYFVVGVFFLRFWTQTKDRLFVWFCAAFWILAFQRVLLTVLGETKETPWYIIIFRLIGYIIILVAIVDKNRSKD